MKKKNVSVIILSYNNLNYLENAINSVLMQDYDNIEIIIQDDHSNNFNSEKIHELLNNKKSNITNVIINSNKENLGTVKNFNAAIKKSHGNYILPLACDDCFIDSSVISDIVNFFEKEHCLICTAKRQGAESNVILPYEKDVSLIKSRNTDAIFARLTINNFYSGSVLYYTREIFEKLNYFDENYCLLEDLPFVTKATLNNIQIPIMDRITIYYGENGISNRKEINPLLKQDFNFYFNEMIFKNRKKIKYRKCKRFVLFKKMRVERDNNKFLFWFYHLFYVFFIDVIFTKMKYKIQKKSESIFWLLYDEFEI